jgi:hypothetical protein
MIMVRPVSPSCLQRRYFCAAGLPGKLGAAAHWLQSASHRTGPNQGGGDLGVR